ncbi:MAG: hypothetical protein ACRDHE_01330 [Ktedonobacterales bacterium]
MRHREPWRRPRTLTVCLACIGVFALLTDGKWLVGVVSLHHWHWYHDSQAHFQVPVPPGWSAMAIPPGQPDNGCGERGVALLPPAIQSLPADTPLANYLPRYIEVNTQVNCMMANLSQDSTLWAEPSQVMIGGALTTLYDRIKNPSGVYVAATAIFGQRQFLFAFSSLTATCTEDSTLFYRVLQEFKYTGS